MTWKDEVVMYMDEKRYDQELMTKGEISSRNILRMMSACDFLPYENSLDSENDGKEQ